jgi:hypothetical protein
MEEDWQKPVDLFAAAEQDYTDFRYPLEILDWKTYSFNREEFDKAKSDGSMKHCRPN